MLETSSSAKLIRKRIQFLFTPTTTDGIGICSAIAVCHARTPAAITDGIMWIAIGNARGPTSPSIPDWIGICSAITVCQAGNPAPITDGINWIAIGNARGPTSSSIADGIIGITISDP